MDSVPNVNSRKAASAVFTAAAAAGYGGKNGAGAPSRADGSSETPSDAALVAASYVIGEHASLLPVQRQRVALSALLSPFIASLSSPGAAEVQTSCVQSAVRVLTQVTASSASEDAASSDAANATLLGGVRAALLLFHASVHPEVLERARGAHAIVSFLSGSDGGEGSRNTGGSSTTRHIDLRRALSTLLSAELRAVAPKAQRKVRPPAELDLKTSLYTATVEDWAVLGVPAHPGGGSEGGSGRGSSTPQRGTVGGEWTAQTSALRPVASGPYYLQSEPRAGPPSHEQAANCGRGGGGNAASVIDGTGGATGVVGGGGVGDLGFGYEDDRGNAVVDLDEAMPDGADHSDEEEKARKAATSGAGAGGDAGRGGDGSEAMLADLLGTDARLGMQEGSTGGERRRRRKHRSDRH